MKNERGHTREIRIRINADHSTCFNGDKFVADISIQISCILRNEARGGARERERERERERSLALLE